MNYKVIGHDGKIYGPVPASQLRLWLEQGRVDNRTAVWVEGAADWTFLGLLPGFPSAFGAAPPPIGSIRPVVAAALKTNPFATWSLICGALAWTCCCCCLPFNLMGLVFGIIALAQISEAGAAREGRGLAVAGLVLSATNLLWCLGWTTLNLATNQAHWLHGFN
jgi:hypothetical protein